MILPGVHHHIHDRNYPDLMKAEKSILVFGRTDCAACATYNEEIEHLVRKPHYKSVVFGKVTLDKPGSLNIKKENPWLETVEGLPYTVLYKLGHKVDGFAASNASYLEERIEDFLFK